MQLGKELLVFFYEFELIKAERDFKKHKRIARIYKRRKKADRQQVQLGFKEHPQDEKFHHWIDEKSLAE